LNPVKSAAEINAEAIELMRKGAVGEARALLSDGAVTHSGDLAIRLNLGGACRALGDIGAALEAVEGALVIAPRSFHALLMKASLLEKRGDLRIAGLGYGLALHQAPRPDQLDEPTRRALQHAREFRAEYELDLRKQLLEATSGAAALGRSPETRRVAAFIDHLSGAQRRYQQEPRVYFYPGLPAIEFYPSEDFPWLADVESATPAIQRELMEVAGGDPEAEGFTPYVNYAAGLPLDQWKELNKSPRWNAYHLISDGAPVRGHADRCPATMAAVRQAPQPVARGRSPVAMFSVLQARTRIPPHTGVSNTRLVVHLPLILPPGCGFRVGNETREWVIGRGWVFDDTIEHEAWNDSDQPRTILIFDIWSPYLSLAERDLISRITEAMDEFHDAGPSGPMRRD
jgi:aspartyl/asparaginyl beta-hydroxylase (cupin superfamily)